MDIDYRIPNLFTTTFDATAALNALDEIKHVFSQNDYEATIQLASTTIARIEQAQLISLLDRRAYALGMQGKFSQAIKDAETMVEYDNRTNSCVGTLRQGNLYALQGKQKRAIQVYIDGFKNWNTTKRNPYYRMLVDAIRKAEAKTYERIDILRLVPLELVDEITQYMSEQECVAALLDVSGSWHHRIVQCKSAWSTLGSSKGEPDNRMRARALPYVASHIKHLSMNTAQQGIWLRYLEYFEKGHFKSLKSLLIEWKASELLDAHGIMSLMTGFWKTRNTLTTLTLELYEDISPLKIAEILFYCPYLKTLSLDTNQDLAHLLGDLDILGVPHELLDLTLKTTSTSGDALKPLMRKCCNLRRLYMAEATFSTLTVVHDACHKLEILGYNPQRTIPGLEMLNKMSEKHNDQGTVTFNKNGEKQGSEGALRAIYTTHDGYGVPDTLFMNLVKKNQKTLERLYAKLSKTQAQVQDDVDIPIPRLSGELVFERLGRLVYWADHHGVLEQRLLQGLRPSIKRFNPIESSNIPAIINRLMELPPLEYLKFSDSTHTNDEERKYAANCLVRLFQYYATFANTNEQQFERFTFEYCDFISDEVLDALTEIKTLKEVCISGNSKLFTEKGYKHFLFKIKKNAIRLTRLKIKQSELFLDRNDMIYETIHTIKSLEIFQLEHMAYVNNNTIQYIVEHAPNSLHTLVIKFCAAAGPKKNDIFSIVNNCPTSNIKHVTFFQYGYDRDEPEEIDI